MQLNQELELYKQLNMQKSKFMKELIKEREKRTESIDNELKG